MRAHVHGCASRGSCYGQCVEVGIARVEVVFSGHAAQPFDHRIIPVAEPHRLPAFGIVVLSQGGLRVLSADQQDALLPLASFKDARREVCKGMYAACPTTRIGPSSLSTEALSSSSGFREPESQSLRASPQHSAVPTCLPPTYTWRSSI